MASAARIASMQLFLALAAAAPALAQTTWHVDVNAPGPGTGTLADPYTSIQYAIDQVTTVAGDTLLVAPGEYVGNIFLNKDLTVRSSGGPLVTTLRPSQPGTLVGVGADAVLEGFTVTGISIPGLTTSGIHVGSDDTGTIRRCIVRDNVGTGISGFGQAVVEHCTITGNKIGLHSYHPDGAVDGVNSIVGFNDANIWTDAYSGGVDMDFSLIGAADPGFWNYAERDLRLRPGAVAIDFGAPASPPDPDGSVADAGALVYDPTYAPEPEVYCTGKLNSQGCVPAIGAIGSASASSAAPFTITASNELPDVPGLLFFGFAPRAAPFQGAWHCVEPPTPRVGGQISAGSGPCGGTFSFDMNAYIQSGVYPSLVPGELVYCQWWSRDLQDPAGFGTGLTDALYFGIAP